MDRVDKRLLDTYWVADHPGKANPLCFCVEEMQSETPALGVLPKRGACKSAAEGARGPRRLLRFDLREGGTAGRRDRFPVAASLVLRTVCTPRLAWPRLLAGNQGVPRRCLTWHGGHCGKPGPAGNCKPREVFPATPRPPLGPIAARSLPRAPLLLHACVQRRCWLPSKAETAWGPEAQGPRVRRQPLCLGERESPKGIKYSSCAGENLGPELAALQSHCSPRRGCLPTHLPGCGRTPGLPGAKGPFLAGDTTLRVV